MSRLSLRNGTVLLPLLMMSGGCTATFQTTPIQPLQRAGDLHIHIASVESNVPEDISREISDLEVELVDRFRALDAVSQVSLGGVPGEHEDAVLVRVSISGIRKIGGARRFFLGEWAGRASMTADVEFIDGDSGIVLGRYEVVGRSGNTKYLGVTGDAVAKTAEAILAVMAEGYTWMPQVPSRGNPAQP
ncbi:MAG: DUF4410 domain-containing protein [Gemmatimonadota bacterium]|nr:MAG: DUF4410 domain-containing protein [Gemmatimonadota bacterium]